MVSNEQDLSLRMQDDEWSKSPGTVLYRKILERRIDEIFQDLIGTIPSLKTTEEIGVAALRAVSRVEGLVTAQEESRTYEDESYG